MSGRITPWTPFGTTLAEIALAWSVISVTWEAEPSTEATRPTRPSPLSTGVVDLDAVAAAHVDRHGRVPGGTACER